MSAELKRFPTEQAGTEDLPAFDLTIVMNLAGERQIHLRSPVTDPISPAEANRRTDALMRVAERQRSLIEIRVLEEELSAKTDALEKVWKARKTEAEEKHAKVLEEVEKAIKTDLTLQEQLKQAEAMKAAGTGRVAEYKLQGNALKNYNTLGTAIDQHRASVKTKEQEHLQHMQTINGNIDKLEAEIREMTRQLERHRAIVG